jgi:hypothetical protein
LRDLLEVMPPEEVEGEKLQEHILTASNYFATRCIACYFNEDLEPSNPENLHCVMLGMLVGYMGKHLLFIRTKIAPNHPDFVNCVNEDTSPTWYTSFRPEFANACNRFQLLHQGDEIFVGRNIHAMYQHNDNDKAGNFLDAKCDLRRMMLSLYKRQHLGMR